MTFGIQKRLFHSALLTVTGERYLLMLGYNLMPELDIFGGKSEWFMQDGVLPYRESPVRDWLDQTFGGRGPLDWAPRPSDLNQLVYSFWGCLKSQV